MLGVQKKTSPSMRRVGNGTSVRRLGRVGTAREERAFAHPTSSVAAATGWVSQGLNPSYQMRMSSVGHSATSRHVRCHGSFSQVRKSGWCWLVRTSLRLAQGRSAGAAMRRASGGASFTAWSQWPRTVAQVSYGGGRHGVDPSPPFLAVEHRRSRSPPRFNTLGKPRIEIPPRDLQVIMVLEVQPKLRLLPKYKPSRSAVSAVMRRRLLTISAMRFGEMPIAFASRLCVRPYPVRNSSFSISPGVTGANSSSTTISPCMARFEARGLDLVFGHRLFP
jgi:hypothetical protein